MTFAPGGVPQATLDEEELHGAGYEGESDSLQAEATMPMDQARFSARAHARPSNPRGQAARGQPPRAASKAAGLKRAARIARHSYCRAMV